MKTGVIIDNFHSEGRVCKSIRVRYILDNGKFIEPFVLLKKIGGRPSGPAAELHFSLGYRGKTGMTNN